LAGLEPLTQARGAAARASSHQEETNGRQDELHPQEWNQILESVMLTAMAVSAADPSGLFGSVKVSTATGRTLLQAKADPSCNELINAVVTDFDSGDAR
jgi:hypothetical protein